MLPPVFHSPAVRWSTRPRMAVALLGMFSTAVFAPALQAASPAPDLIAAINQYRQQNGLPAIPASPKLNAVAAAHVKDVITYHPEKQCGGNLHSWSSHGNWKGGCYDSKNSSTWPVMWNKPQEIAHYPSKGYEISASGVSSAQDSLGLWKSSAAHCAVILNQGMWSSYQWKAVGAAYDGGYACVWFGADADASQPAMKMLVRPPYDKPKIKRVPLDGLKRIK